ncbi:DUF3232 domain-containing protein [Butyrivibrio sp. AE2032]|uniref:DUF3232 domain-containing protein n=1 Tax=Butyrivibrio sp. AE2032 TaxID=1458463 RepID=UPI00055114F9|nr:DUF3232 domain-containing protein [Butyrivibrio sp. AE2032]
MDIIARLTELFETLDKSDLPNKAELKAEVKCCIDAMMHYFSVVSNEQLHYLENPKDNLNMTSMMVLEKQRSEAHDAAINACSKINEICSEVNTEVICDFDTNDRRKVAEFCGIVTGALFFSNINSMVMFGRWLQFTEKIKP